SQSITRLLDYPITRFTLLLCDRSQVVDDVPDLVVFERVLEGHHVEVWLDAILDDQEDGAVGFRLHRVIDEAGRGGNEIVAGSAFSAGRVARRTAPHVDLLSCRY